MANSKGDEQADSALAQEGGFWSFEPNENDTPMPDTKNSSASRQARGRSTIERKRLAGAFRSEINQPFVGAEGRRGVSRGPRIAEGGRSLSRSA